MKKLSNYREALNLFIIGFLGLTSILPGIYYTIYNHIPNFLLDENGIYETIGAVACFTAGLVFFYSFKLSTQKKLYLYSLWMLLFAIGCLFIAGEEISWGQHLLNYNVPDYIIINNFQQEFNLHNSMLIQSSNNSLSSIFFKLLIFYFILFPMLLEILPTIKQWSKKIFIPIPSMLIAIIALTAKFADIINHKIIYGTSFTRDTLSLGEGLESTFELCLLILAIECLFFARKNHD